MQPILLATDGSPAAEEATRAAIDHAKAFDAPLLVVTAWGVTYEPIGLFYGPVIPDVDHVGHEQAQEVVAHAATQARREGVEVEALVCRGNPIERICTLAEEHDARLIVVGSHGWGPFKRALFGSVSTGVLHHARRPVLVVRSGAPSHREITEERRKLSVVT
jgi:nucleotide-binding universal stress UspA family protein